MRRSRAARLGLAACLGSFLLLVFYFQSSLHPVFPGSDSCSQCSEAQDAAFEEPELKVQRRLSAKALGNLGWKTLSSTFFEEDMKCCTLDLLW
ncbi:hypothetical protein Q9233_006984 [Columba guinea]|nr:hypothetical protein Q9233_006984 [Columba guinea]